MSILFALLLASTDAAANPQPVTATETAVPAAAPKKVKEKKICKTDDADSGSHMVRRICLTEQEWQLRGQGMTNSSRSGFSGKAQDQ
ncbi:MAG: hypothetical protein QOK41_1756 [Sphingomonadales bacterium]|jgi:hypothetical protein|nr:hypothetical protein [Sphingomonadales bacterium]